MSVLSIRNVPEDVVRALKRMAGGRGQSMESLARETLIGLVRPTLHLQEAEFWANLRAELEPGDAEAFQDALQSLRDENYAPPDLL
jgi:hypothetical protein